jgi:hypothetical protein
VSRTATGADAADPDLEQLAMIARAGGHLVGRRRLPVIGSQEGPAAGDLVSELARGRAGSVVGEHVERHLVEVWLIIRRGLTGSARPTRPRGLATPRARSTCPPTAPGKAPSGPWPRFAERRDDLYAQRRVAEARLDHPSRLSSRQQTTQPHPRRGDPQHPFPPILVNGDQYIPLPLARLLADPPRRGNRRRGGPVAASRPWSWSAG